MLYLRGASAITLKAQADSPHRFSAGSAETAAAKAEYDKRKRARTKLTLSLADWVDMLTEAQLSLSGSDRLDHFQHHSQYRFGWVGHGRGKIAIVSNNQLHTEKDIYRIKCPKGRQSIESRIYKRLEDIFHKVIHS